MRNPLSLILLTFVFAVFTTASVTNTITTGKIFLPLRTWVTRQRNRPDRSDVVKGILFVPLCQYCCSHWVGLAVLVLFRLPWIAIFPVIWCAQHLMLWSVTQGKKLELLHATNEAYQAYARTGGNPPPVRTA